MYKHQLRELGTSLIELWTLMDTSAEEQQLFGYVTCILNMSEDEVSSPQSLALGNIEQVRIISAIGSTLRESCQNALIMLHIFRNTLSNVIRNISFLNRFYAMEMFFLVKFEKRKSYLDKYLEDLGSLIFFLTFNPSNYMDFDGFMRFCAYDLG